jgi:hypothetical protein
MSTERPKKQTHVQILDGGLDDSDAEAVNPFSKPRTLSKPHMLTKEELLKAQDSKKAKRDISRQNDVNYLILIILSVDPFIQLVSIDEEEDYIPHQASKKFAAKTQRPQAVITKRENPVTAVTVKTKTKHLNGNNVRMSDLPSFAIGKWRDTFLPTLYDKFFTSDQPFEGFYKGSDQFIGLLQGIIVEVYPEINYVVTASDSIHFLVRYFALIIPLYESVYLSRRIIGSMKSGQV